MKKIIVGILSLVFIITIIGCSEETDPKFRVQNERSDKANVQFQTSGGNTININEVAAGQTTEYQIVAEGNTIVTAVIQKESISPSITFFAEKDKRFTIVIQSGITPVLRVDQE
ncbi:MAG: hypothetical protein KJ571_10675 [Bacteroidetes bacterium]|nr:hypothetical protein [Bacteroidota bacterium]